MSKPLRELRDWIDYEWQVWFDRRDGYGYADGYLDALDAVEQKIHEMLWAPPDPDSRVLYGAYLKGIREELWRHVAQRWKIGY